MASEPAAQAPWLAVQRCAPTSRAIASLSRSMRMIWASLSPTGTRRSPWLPISAIWTSPSRRPAVATASRAATSPNSSARDWSDGSDRSRPGTVAATLHPPGLTAPIPVTQTVLAVMSPTHRAREPGLDEVEDGANAERAGHPRQLLVAQLAAELVGLREEPGEVAE